MRTCLGVNIASGKKPFTFMVLDAELHLQAIGKGDLSDIVAFTAGQSEACIAVNAPSELNKGEMKNKEIQKKFSAPPVQGRWTDSRVVEYELFLKGVDVPHTPAKLKGCPGWILNGFLFYEQLTALEYQPFPAVNADRLWLETQTEAAFWSILGKPLFKPGTLEGRLQRQLILHEQKLPVDDPMDFFEEVTRFRLLHGTLPIDDVMPDDELNALMAAYTAWLCENQPENIATWGKPHEGLIHLPQKLPQEERHYERIHVD